MTAITMTSAPVVHLRLTRRGRRVITAMVTIPLVLGAAAFLLWGGVGAVATTSSSSATFDYVVVKGGETLWTIAERVAPQADPRDVIAEFVSLNNLSTSTVQPGQRLAVPGAYDSH